MGFDFGMNDESHDAVLRSLEAIRPRDKIETVKKNESTNRGNGTERRTIGGTPNQESRTRQICLGGLSGRTAAK